MLDILIIDECVEINNMYQKIFDGMNLSCQIETKPDKFISTYDKRQTSFKLLIIDTTFNFDVYDFLRFYDKNFISLIVSKDNISEDSDNLPLERVTKPFNPDNFANLITSKLQEYHKLHSIPENSKTIYSK